MDSATLYLIVLLLGGAPAAQAAPTHAATCAALPAGPSNVSLERARLIDCRAKLAALRQLEAASARSASPFTAQ